MTGTGPYRRAAAGYRRMGWSNPIPVQGKDRPPAGFTGKDGVDVTDADVARWSRGPEGTRNIALRLPDGIIGIDVDAHDGKRGHETLAVAEAALGQLPATWSSTSRGADQPSRIHLYRVPTGLDWSHAETNLRRFGPHLDVLHRGHRYALVAPSEHPTTRKAYRWYLPGPLQPVKGIASGQAPAPTDLAELPTPWVEFLTAPPNRPEPRRGRPVRMDRGTPWQAYNADTDIGTDLLAPAGWTFCYRKGQVEYWRRPGKASSGHSASIGDGHDEDGNPALWLFTTSTEFEPGRYYDATGAYAVLHHRGDRSAACKALYEQGYGDRAEPPPDDGWQWPAEEPGRERSERSERSEQRMPEADLLSPSSLSSQWPTLDPAALHGIAGTVVKTLGPHTEADPVALLLTFLAAAGNILGLGPHAVADAAAHPARLNVVLVGQTSRARKGTAWAQIRTLLSLVDPSWTTGCVLPGIASGEALIAEVRDGTSDEDLGVADKRRLVLEPEFARLLAVAAREGSILSAVLREAWDGNVLKNRTKAFPRWPPAPTSVWSATSPERSCCAASPTPRPPTASPTGSCSRWCGGPSGSPRAASSTRPPWTTWPTRSAPPWNAATGSAPCTATPTPGSCGPRPTTTSATAAQAWPARSPPDRRPRPSGCRSPTRPWTAHRSSPPPTSRPPWPSGPTARPAPWPSSAMPWAIRSPIVSWPRCVMPARAWTAPLSPPCSVATPAPSDWPRPAPCWRARA
jgi:hypothetical protein